MPPPSEPQPSARERALAHLHRFESHYLTFALRRLTQWKNLPQNRALALADDLRQELAVDCLEHTDLINSLDDFARHRRWFRLVQAAHYRLHSRDARLDSGFDGFDELPDSAPPVDLESLDSLGNERDRLRTILFSAVHLKNGRLNVDATARALGLERRPFHLLWRRLVTQLGFGDSFVEFWRRRLVEALIQHAANLLRERDAVRHCGAAARRIADPAISRRRIERVRDALSSHPPSPELKPILSRTLTMLSDPTALLDLAAQLEPLNPTVHLWKFENSLALGDVSAAATALAAARTHECGGVPLVLARARLLEARGRASAAAALLQRAIARDSDPRLAHSLASLLRVMNRAR